MIFIAPFVYERQRLWAEGAVRKASAARASEVAALIEAARVEARAVPEKVSTAAPVFRALPTAPELPKA